MARGQQQGFGSVTIWMIVFVALWLTSTVFLVLLYTAQEELTTENDSLREDNAVLIPLLGDKISVAVAGANTTGIVVKATIVLKR